MTFKECILVFGSWLGLAPVTVKNVLAGVDGTPGARHRPLVDRVRGHGTSTQRPSTGRNGHVPAPSADLRRPPTCSPAPLATPFRPAASSPHRIRMDPIERSNRHVRQSFPASLACVKDSLR